MVNCIQIYNYFIKRTLFINNCNSNYPANLCILLKIIPKGTYSSFNDKTQSIKPAVARKEHSPENSKIDIRGLQNEIRELHKKEVVYKRKKVVICFIFLRPSFDKDYISFKGS